MFGVTLITRHWTAFREMASTKSAIELPLHNKVALFSLHITQLLCHYGTSILFWNPAKREISHLTVNATMKLCEAG